MKKLVCILAVLTLGYAATAQVGIGNTDPKASLDISAKVTPDNTDGLLIPRIDNFPTPAPTVDQDGMMVFATGAGAPAKGFYYWDNGLNSWITVTGAGGGTLGEAYDFGGAGNGRVINANDGAVTISGEDGITITGEYNSGATIPATTVTSLMFFNPRKSAFRAGKVTSGLWDDLNVGAVSTAFGQNNTASGGIATAFGSLNDASGSVSTVFGIGNDAIGSQSFVFGNFNDAAGDYSTAFGDGNIANGLYSTVFGAGNNASGELSTSFGENNVVSGENSTGFGTNNTVSGIRATAFGNQNSASNNNATAFGSNNDATAPNATAFGFINTASGTAATAYGSGNSAPSFAETTIGTFSSTYTPLSTFLFNTNDKIFTIGNGTNNTSRSNALTIYKSGLMNINDAYNMPLTDGTSGQVMTTDGSGNITFQTPGDDGDWTIVGPDIERQSGDVYIGSDATTNNKLVVSGIIEDWDNAAFYLDPNATSAVDEINFSNGTAVDPSIHFGADTNSGFFRSAIDEIGVSTNGTERFRFTNKSQIEFPNGGSSVFIGNNAGENDDLNNNRNVFIGENAGRENTSGIGNIFTGYSTGLNNTTGGNNIAVGSLSLRDNEAGFNNIAIGWQNNIRGTGSFNVTMGDNTAVRLGTGDRNVMIGPSAGNRDELTSSNNVYIGSFAGGGATNNGMPPYYEKSGNVFIGNEAGRYQTVSNTLFIENTAADEDNALIYGEFGTNATATGNVLRTNSQFQIGNPTGTGYAFPTADGANSQVLTTNGSGQLSFTTPVASGLTLDQAYDFGGPGAGRVINTTNGAVDLQGVGGIQVGAGSASAPTIKLNDNNTGFYSPGANLGSYSAGGVERIRIQSDGELSLGNSFTPSNYVFSVTTPSDLNQIRIG